MKASDYRLTPNDIDAMTFAQIGLYYDADDAPISIQDADESVATYWRDRATAEGKTEERCRADAELLLQLEGGR